MKCTMMKQILALLSWGQICIPKEPEAFTFAKMEVGHPVSRVVITRVRYMTRNMQWKIVFYMVLLSKIRYGFERKNHNKEHHMRILLAKFETTELEKMKRQDAEVWINFNNSLGMDEIMLGTEFYSWSDIPK